MLNKLEPHDGSTAGRQSGTAIKVHTGPESVFRLKSRNVLTLTGGSTTTAVIAGLLPQTNDLWIGGYIEILTCAADSTLVGNKYKITDSVGSSGTLTIGETLPATLASGDTIYLTPGNLAIGEYGWDLDGDNTDVDWDTSGGEAVQLVGVDPERFVSFWKLRLHQLGNDAAAK